MTLNVRTLLARLPVWLQKPVCLLLTGHVLHPRSDAARVLFLYCELCPHETAGVADTGTHFRRTRQGDPRRHVLGTTPAIVPVRVSPEPLPDDWFAEEHFQGEHARVL